MNRDEAIKALDEGKTLTHNEIAHFKWVKKQDDHTYKVQGGYISKWLFWRFVKSWDEEWKEYNPNT